MLKMTYQHTGDINMETESPTFFADVNNWAWVNNPAMPPAPPPHTPFKIYKTRFGSILRPFLIVLPMFALLIANYVNERAELVTFLADSVEIEGFSQACENDSILSKVFDYTYATPESPNDFYFSHDSLLGTCSEQESEEGTSVMVLYLPDRPQDSHSMQGIDDGFTRNSLALVAYSLQFVGATLLGFQCWRQMRRFSRLETGVNVVRGNVVDISKSWWRNPWVSIRYQFTNADGEVIEGRRSVRPFSIDQLPESGVPVVVLYVDDRTHWML